MKCFYCSRSDDGKEAGNCSGCGKSLERFCPACGIKYEKNAKFCMSCGGKLEELLPKAEKKPSPAPVEAAGASELEFDDGIPRGKSDIDETTEKKPKGLTAEKCPI